MKTQPLLAVTFGALLLLSTSPARPQGDAPADPRSSTGSKRLVLVELFTSQG